MPITRPPVHYATTADGLEIAYQVLGNGPLDVVIVPGMSGNLDWNAELPFYGGYLRRFPRFARTIVLDRRGAGVSDREVGSGSAEDRMDDVRAVMDAVGCGRAALLGQLEGGAIAILFAATYPERVSALVLVETPARRLRAPDYPEGSSADLSKLQSPTTVRTGGQDARYSLSPATLGTRRRPSPRSRCSSVNRLPKLTPYRRPILPPSVGALGR